MVGMSVARRRTMYSVAEYVELEDYSNVRHEWLDGQILAMAGGTPEHATYCANVIALLAAQLRDKPCRVQSSDGRIRITATGLITYPDVSVVCGRAERDAEDKNAITNPKVIVEVLSPRTEDYDRGEKLLHFQQLPSLEEIVFVSHSRQCVEVFRRAGAVWSRHEAGPGTSIKLVSIDCELVVDDVYRDPLAGL
jgi:Uma2 family endonuclease